MARPKNPRQSNRWRLFLLLLWAICLSHNTLLASDSTAEAKPTVDFQSQIRPILATHCFACHGPDEQARESDLRLDGADKVDELASRGIIVPGKPAESDLLERVTTSDNDLRMPPEGPRLSNVEIQLLSDWITSGGTMDPHWAYEAPQRPAVPIDRDGWPQNPIDAFVAARLRTKALRPSERASRRQLLRRISLLTRGLPPTPTEHETANQLNDSISPIIDRWLASPEFGERMAQDWLDAVRYADTSGHAADKPRTMWLYRNWVIDALNRDMSFDKFTVEQLAGDMLESPETSQLVATGFHRNSMQALGNNPRKEEFRVKGIVDRLETTGRVWLGTTLACAECHDHKYDPISTREYYELFAIFNNVPHLGEKFEVHGPRIGVEVDGTTKVQAQVMAELTNPRKTNIHIRGNFETPGERVRASVPAILGPTGHREISNRLQFAEWLVDESHPLTARVVVNRIWQHYFGQGLVRTPDDFGVRGQPPTHPHLLDWLAVEFVESNWSVKHIHRLILNSATFQQSSAFSPALLQKDPDNLWLARFPRRRASAEVIRDTLLAVSGQLTRQIGGRSIYPYKPVGVDKFKDATAGEWKQDEAPDQFRRGIYVFWQRTSPYPSMTIFDASSRERCTVQRDITSTPLQALALLNDPVYVEAAAALAKRVLDSHEAFDERVTRIFALALNRVPHQMEREQFKRFYENIIQVSSDEDAWSQLAAVMLNLDAVISIE